MGKESNESVSNKTPRLTFSVSKEFAHLVEDVENLPNKSRFVCEAIQEKFDRMKNPGKDIAQALENFMQIQSIISQPMQQTTQQTVQGDGLKSFQTHPPSSPPLDSTENKESLNHETSVVSSENEEVKPSQIVEETSTIVKEVEVEIVTPISNEDKTVPVTNDIVKEQSSEPVLTEAERIKQEARAKYFKKG